MRTIEKPNIFIDLDGCVFNTIKCICDLYNEDFKYYASFKKVNWWQVETWDFEELSAAPKTYIDTYFNQPRFFEKVEYMDHVAKETIELLSKKFNVIFVSAGYSPNLKLKEKWVSEEFPFAKFIGVNLKYYEDKSHIDMSGGVFIDDSEHNLLTSNAMLKICFGDVYDWNKNWNKVRCANWADVKRFLSGDIDFLTEA